MNRDKYTVLGMAFGFLLVSVVVNVLIHVGISGTPSKARLATMLAKDFSLFYAYHGRTDPDERFKAINPGLAFLERLETMGAENVKCEKLYDVVRFCRVEGDDQIGSIFIQEAFPDWLKCFGIMQTTPNGTEAARPKGAGP